MKGRNSWWLLLLAALIIAAVLAPLASRNPDGLDRVAQDQGFAGRAKTVLRGPFPEYAVAGIKHSGVSTAVAGVGGTLLTLALGLGVATLIVKRGSKPGE